MKLPMKKLRKLRRDPDQFFYDLFAKRLGAQDGAAGGAKPAGTVGLDTTDYDVDGSVVVITNPQVVRRLRDLQGSNRRTKLSLTWWVS